MAHGLIALGSNLGDRAATLRQAMADLSQLPATQLLARSSWHETRAIGGPAGQGVFLNAAAVVETGLPHNRLLAELQKIELSLGRQRTERWAARTIDLDLLLYESAVDRTAQLELPHPRMAYRPFVLAPAAEVAGQMVHPESGWTLAALAGHLEQSNESVAIAAVDRSIADRLVGAISDKLSLEIGSTKSGEAADPRRPVLMLWPADAATKCSARPKLLIGLIALGGVDTGAARKMLHLPPTGPVAWIDVESPTQVEESLAAVQAVWPELAT